MEPEFGAVAPASALRETLSNLIPAPVATLDFVAGSYVVDGVAYAATEVFASDSNWSDFVAADITANVGYVCSDTSGGGKFAGALRTLTLGLTSYAIMLEYNPKTNAAVEFDIYSNPGFSDEFYFSGGTTVTNAAQNSGTNPKRINFISSISTSPAGQTEVDLSRVAILVTPDLYAASFIGAGIGVSARQRVLANTWTFQVAEGAIVRKIAVFSDISDISTLQMIAARGID